MRDNLYGLILSDRASEEFEKDYEWYEGEHEGLGERFAEAIQSKIEKILENPYHYKVTRKKQHEAVVEIFPYVILYVVNERAKEILIAAIFHTSRDPKKKFRK